MTRQEIIQAVKSAIAEAETSEALEILISYLESDKSNRTMVRIARLAQAKYEGVEKDFQEGIIEKAEANPIYNKVNRTLLQLVGDLEHDTFDLAKYEADMQPKEGQKQLTRILTGIFLVLLSGLGYWVYITMIPLTCPNFKDDAIFKVLLLPFEPNKVDALTPDVTIKRRLADKSSNEDLNISIEIDKDYFDHHDTPSKEEAMDAGNNCGAEMVIWGTWEKVADKIIVITDFKYLGTRDHFGFQKLKLESNDQIDTIFAMSNIETQGRLTEDIEKVIDNYFGLIAGLSGQPQAAIESLKKSVPLGTDTMAFLLNQMTLADNYIAMGDMESASKVYDDILAVHPDYGFARNNRGVLSYKQGQYAKSVEDMTVKLAQTPNDADALIVRASAYLQQEDLKKAEKDLERAAIVQPSKQQQINIKMRVLEQEKRNKASKIESATTELRSNPNSVRALNNRAALYQSLGEYEMAIKDAEKAIVIDNKNKVAYENLIKALSNKNEPTKARQILRQGQAKGLDLKHLKNRTIQKKLPKN